MSKAEKIMNENINNADKLEKMKKHYYKVDKWLDENEHKQEKYSQDELYEMVSEVLDDIVILEKRRNYEKN